MRDQLHPASFVETQDCEGPRDIRNQPSRETPGVLLEEKYITEQDPQLSVDFNLPFRNSLKYVDMLNIMFDKLDPDQKKIVLSKMSFLQKDHVENFESLPSIPIISQALVMAVVILISIIMLYFLFLVARKYYKKR
jgi:hypothetical protein